MKSQYDVAVVGAGIVGLAHAWMAARRGLRVVVLERDSRAQGASIRNFGMIWPIGQPAGEPYRLALESRGLWLELQAENALVVEECGSLHLAHHADELAVLEEFSAEGQHDARMLSAAEVAGRSPLANPAGLLGGLWSPTELRVDPRTASEKLATWLRQRYQVDFLFDTPVIKIADRSCRTADDQTVRAERIILCSGSDLRTLFRHQFEASGLRLCKLQMLSTAAKSPFPSPAPHIASGLTLRHYRSFESLSSLKTLRSRVQAETPELDRYGIHVMASAFPGGEIILGDSHEYDDEISPFNKEEVDALILRELRKVITLDNWKIVRRWSGIYAKHPENPVYRAKVADGVDVFVGTGGAGMTMAFGLAQQSWRDWETTNGE